MAIEPANIRNANTQGVNLAALEGVLRRPLLLAVTILSVAIAAALLRLGMAPHRVALSPYVPALALGLHLASVVPAVPLGAYILLRRKGDRTHKRLGRIWGGLMLCAALSSFWLKGLAGGSFSPIHLLSVLTLVTLPLAIVNARQGRIAAHRRTMVILFVSLILAGAFAFLPGRLMYLWLVR